MRIAKVLLPGLLLVPAWGLAGKADVVDVKAYETGKSYYTFEITVQNADEGWKHYADASEIVTPDGQILATLKYRGPHVHEQPFMRVKARVRIPRGVDEVIVRASDSEHGYGGKEITVEIP